MSREPLITWDLLASGLWAVVNNAGISQWAEIEWSSITDFSNMVDINLFGAIRTTLAFLPLVRASRGAPESRCSVCSFLLVFSLSFDGLQVGWFTPPASSPSSPA